MIANKNPVALAGATPGLLQASQADVSRRPRKWARVLAALAEGRSFNRFEAERALFDHCLHSTVATIQAKGIAVARRDEIVPGFQDIPTHVTRYWLTDDARAQARAILPPEILDAATARDEEVT